MLSASARSMLFMSFIMPISHEMFPWYLFLLKRSLVFTILLVSSVSLHWSVRKAFLSRLPILWNSAFGWVYLSFSPLPLTSLLFSAICKAFSDNHFAFFVFLFLGDGFDHCLPTKGTVQSFSSSSQAQEQGTDTQFTHAQVPWCIGCPRCHYPEHAFLKAAENCIKKP